MFEIFKNLILGMVIWGIFTIFKLDIPSPPTLAGLVWIVWIYLWYIIIWKYL